MAFQEPKEQRITQSETITKIILRLAQSGLPVSLRRPDKPEISVRAKIGAIDQTRQVQSLRLTDVSDKGLIYLNERRHEIVMVEFSLSTSKITFETRLIERESHNIYLSFPTALVSVERRKNQRHNSTNELPAFLRTNVPPLQCSEWAYPPKFFLNEPRHIKFLVGDISNGGISVVSRFPVALLIFKKIEKPLHETLYFPMQEGIAVSYLVRWVKKIKENIADEAGYSRLIRTYRFGLEFVDISDEGLGRVKQYIHLLDQAVGI